MSSIRDTPGKTVAGADQKANSSKRYWFDTELKSDWKSARRSRVVITGTTTDVGEILEAAGPRRLSYTFHHVLSEAPARSADKVVFISNRTARLVKLTLTHEIISRRAA